MFLLMAIAGIFGAAGVGAAAISVHRATGPDLQIAAYFLLFHAAAIAGIAGSTVRPHAGFLVSASVLATGVCLFCGDLTLRALVGTPLFPTAAPIGGTLLLLGWLTLTFAAIGGLFKREPTE
jgi:uncharacterized membrane protein YgdD (TMEM256/DUF423 family)